MFETEEEMERFSTQLILFSSCSAAAAADATGSSPKLLLSSLLEVAAFEL